jgi:hypothetical protein
MPATFTLISSVTVGSGGAGTIVFSSIPATYTDLVLKYSARRASGAESNIQLSFNTGSTYAGRRLFGDGSAAASDTTTEWGGFIVGATQTASTFANNEVYIPNYTSSNAKSWSIDAVDENNATGALMGLGAQLWNGTAAITTITLTASNDFAQHSTAYLYGISNA